MSRFTIALTIAVATLSGPAASQGATRARTVAETVLNAAPVRLAVGNSHACQVKDDGTVQCWGSNTSGQLGDGTTMARSTPVAVSGIFNAVAVSAGALHTCALLADGTVRCWGDNRTGQLGNGTTTGALTPVPNFLINIVAVAAGGAHTCALQVNGAVLCG